MELFMSNLSILPESTWKMYNIISANAYCTSNAECCRNRLRTNDRGSGRSPCCTPQCYYYHHLTLLLLSTPPLPPHQTIANLFSALLLIVNALDTQWYHPVFYSLTCWTRVCCCCVVPMSMSMRQYQRDYHNDRQFADIILLFRGRKHNQRVVVVIIITTPNKLVDFWYHF